MSKITDHARSELERDLGRPIYVQIDPYQKLTHEEILAFTGADKRTEEAPQGEQRADAIMEDYMDTIAAHVMQLVQIFADQGHSGMSGSATLYLLNKLANFKNTSPLTSDPDEWYQHAPDNWQSRRSSSCFSNDQGKTYVDNDEIERNEDGTYKRDDQGKVIQPIHDTIDHTKPQEEQS